MPSSTRSAKAVAVAVAVVGVAGLSLASAAELTTTGPAAGLQAGLVTDATCQRTPLGVVSDQAPGALAATVSVQGFSATCTGRPYRVVLSDAAGAVVATAGGVLADEAVVVDVPGGVADVTEILVTVS